MTKFKLQDAAWIGSTLPSDFESYCKILHPFTVFDDVPDTLIPEAQWKKPGAFQGRLSMPVLSIILDILKQYSPENKVRICQLTPHSIRWEDEVVEGSYDEVPDYFDKRYFIGWLFPPDRSWALYTDTDLCYTLMGGPSSLIDRLAESPLEVVTSSSSPLPAF